MREPPVRVVIYSGALDGPPDFLDRSDRLQAALDEQYDRDMAAWEADKEAAFWAEYGDNDNGHEEAETPAAAPVTRRPIERSERVTADSPALAAAKEVRDQLGLNISDDQLREEVQRVHASHDSAERRALGTGHSGERADRVFAIAKEINERHGFGLSDEKLKAQADIVAAGQGSE